MPIALIVEDEPEANKLLALLVQLRGYSTVSAFTGSEALEKVQNGQPDIVFLDLMLPDINGYEVCRRLKSRKSTSLIPVVMVTARVAAENRRESFCVGADDYIPKPYTPDQIFHAMEEADAWRKDVEHNGRGHAGEIVFRIDSDESLRQLAQLRNLLVARTPLDVESVNRMGEAFQVVRASAERWGRLRALNAPASLAYEIRSDRAVFTLEDGCDWIAETRHAAGETWPSVLADAGLELVEDRADERQLVVARRFPFGQSTGTPL